MMGKRFLCQNETRAVVIGDRIRKADHYFSRLFGLLPKSSLEPGEGLWIYPCNDIHSIGMRFRFDALFLDKELRVVHLVEDMGPWKVTPIIRQAKSVLELGSGVIAQTGTQLGDQLSFKQQ